LSRIPPAGFIRISDEELTWATAETYDRPIQKGGIVELPDGMRYSDPQLLLIQGERRQVNRARHDHGLIKVLPAAKGENVIVARLRGRVGGNDPDQLSREMELQNRLRKLVGNTVKPLEYEPIPAPPDSPTSRSDVSEPMPARSEASGQVRIVHSTLSRAEQAELRVRLEQIDVGTAQAPLPGSTIEPPPAEVTPTMEISGPEYFMAKKRKPLDFADLED
jgi:hypothetical protein